MAEDIYGSDFAHGIKNAVKEVEEAFNKLAIRTPKSNTQQYLKITPAIRKRILSKPD